MKKLFFLHFIPVCLCLSTLYFLVRTHTQTNLDHSKPVILTDSVKVIPTFDSNPILEEAFLNSKRRKTSIHVLGSSELACTSPSVVHSFIPKQTGVSVTSVGREGNQSFSMYLQLLANRERLKNKNIVFIISPVWFNRYNCMGTRATVLLRYASDAFLNRVMQDDVVNPLYKSYAYKRIAETFRQDKLPQRLAVAKIVNTVPDKRTKSFIGLLVNSTIAQLDALMFHFFNVNKPLNSHFNNHFVFSNPPIHKTINWDSLFVHTRNKVANSITTNDWGMEDSFYTERINGNQRLVHMPDDENTPELSDFKMLVSFCKDEMVNASFIILPMNPYYLTNLDTLTPIVGQLEREIKSADFPYLNMWQTDTAFYDKYILSDELHLSEYGWYVADKFIADNINWSDEE